jgi:hypothetical protein
MYSRCDHPENKLAKFGYILNTKIEKQIESFYILGYLQEITIKILGFGEEIWNLANLGHIFREKIFVMPSPKWRKLANKGGRIMRNEMFSLLLDEKPCFRRLQLLHFLLNLGRVKNY